MLKYQCWSGIMLRNKDILAEKNKLLRKKSEEVTFPISKEDLDTIDKMI